MKIFNLETSNDVALKFINKQQQQNSKVANLVAKIVNNIKKNQDQALLDYCRQFDGMLCQSTSELLVDQQQIHDS